MLKVEFNELKIKKSQCDNISGNRNFCRISYEQEYKNIPIYNSYVSLYSMNDNLVLYKSKYFPDIELDPKPKIKKDKAVEIVSEFYNISKSDIESISLVIYPYEKYFILAYRIELPEMNFSKYTVFIDANSWEILYYFDNTYEYDISGTVTGMIYPNNENEEKILVQFKDLYINTSSRIKTTNENGFYEFLGLEGLTEILSYLEGPWVKVIDYQGDESN